MRQELAAVIARCNNLEAEANAKAEERFRKQEQRMKKDLTESQKLRVEAEKGKKKAEASYTQAEAARIIADEERQQLLADRSNTTGNLLKELQRYNRRDDSSDDEDSGCPRTKKCKSAQSELFTLDGELKIAPSYSGMDMSNLVMHSMVSNEIISQIANNEFFDLQEMFNGEELTTADGTSSSKQKTCKPITKKQEIFFLLYTFGQYYLQIFPAKAAGFLEYLAYLTKYGAPFNVPGLLKLDSALRVHYIKHPEWNWDQNNFTIYRQYDLLSRDPENLLPGQQPLAFRPHYRGGKQKSVFHQNNVQFRQPMQASVPPSFQPNHPQGAAQFQYNSQQPSTSHGGHQSSAVQQLLLQNPGITQERCKGWNFNLAGCRFTPYPGCVRKHECYICGDRVHKAPHCPKQRQWGRR